MTPTTLSAALAAQANRLTQLAKHLAGEGHERLGACLTFHAAQLACLETTARRLEQDLASTQAMLNGSRAALAQSRATVQHLTAELLEEQDLARTAEPPPNPAHQATIDRIRANLPRLIR